MGTGMNEWYMCMMYMWMEENRMMICMISIHNIGGKERNERWRDGQRMQKWIRKSSGVDVMGGDIDGDMGQIYYHVHCQKLEVPPNAGCFRIAASNLWGHRLHATWHFLQCQLGPMPHAPSLSLSLHRSQLCD